MFAELVQTACFKAAALRPCMLTRIAFDVEHPDDDQVLVVLTAVAVPLQLDPAFAPGPPDASADSPPMPLVRPRPPAAAARR